MPEYKTPGVYVQEVPSGMGSITGVPMDTTGFAGPTERGPLAPQLISSWQEFQAWYGGFMPEYSYLAYAVRGFFDNGGRRCFIARIVGAQAAYAGVQVDGKLNVTAAGPGSWGSHLRLEVAAAGDGASPQSFQIIVTCDPGLDAAATLSERFENLLFAPGAAGDAAALINASSRLVRAWCEREPDPNISESLAVGVYALTNPPGDADGPLTAADFAGDDSPLSSRMNLPAGATRLPPADLLGQGWGLRGLAAVDEIALLTAPDEVRFPGPGESRSPVSELVVQQCELRKDRFAILSCYQGQAATSVNPPFDTSMAVFYYPWIKVSDPLSGDSRLVPASGHIAGIYARLAVEQGVNQTPANEVVQGALALEIPVTNAMQELLNPRGINCLRDFQERGIRVWGARTLSSDPEWRYIAVRRTALYLEQSITEGLKWVVFEPNGEPLWARVRASIEDFLVDFWRGGGLQANRPEDGFFVRCDRTTMTQNDLDNGRLVCLVGFAPLQPGEFIILRISQKTAGAP